MPLDHISGLGKEMPKNYCILYSKDGAVYRSEQFNITEAFDKLKNTWPSGVIVLSSSIVKEGVASV